MKTDQGIYNSLLACNLCGIDLFADNLAIIYVPESNATSMTGAINIVKSLNENIRMIMVLAGSRKDVIYARSSNGWWDAYDLRQSRLQ